MLEEAAYWLEKAYENRELETGIIIEARWFFCSLKISLTILPCKQHWINLNLIHYLKLEGRILP